MTVFLWNHDNITALLRTEEDTQMEFVPVHVGLSVAHSRHSQAPKDQTHEFRRDHRKQYGNNCGHAPRGIGQGTIVEQELLFSKDV